MDVYEILENLGLPTHIICLIADFGFRTCGWCEKRDQMVRTHICNKNCSLAFNYREGNNIHDTRWPEDIKHDFNWRILLKDLTLKDSKSERSKYYCLYCRNNHRISIDKHRKVIQESLIKKKELEREKKRILEEEYRKEMIEEDINMQKYRNMIMEMGRFKSLYSICEPTFNRTLDDFYKDRIGKITTPLVWKPGFLMLSKPF